LAITLALGGKDPGYAFEAEIIIRAIAAKVSIVEVPIDVIYPPAHERVTHFDSVRDPARISWRVASTLIDVRLHPVKLPKPTPVVQRASSRQSVAEL
jgi:hypothetical protein